jgi:hypothetical protein
MALNIGLYLYSIDDIEEINFDDVKDETTVLLITGGKKLSPNIHKKFLKLINTSNLFADHLYEI